MSAIVITLDSIFDTRTALWMRLLDEDVLKDLLNDGYYTRLTDVYPKHYDPAKFRDLYDNRDITLLRESFVTQAMDLTHDLYNRALAKATAGPGDELPYIVISTYPYKLSDGEISDIAACIADTTSEDIDLRFVHKRREVNRDDLRALKAIAFITYEGERWLASEYATDVTAETILPYTLLITPLLKTTFEDVSDEDIKKSADAFKEELASIICRFEWTSASTFTTIMLNPQVVGAQSLMDLHSSVHHS